MNLVQDVFSSRSLNKWLPWLAVVVLAAGVITFVAVNVGAASKPGVEIGIGKLSSPFPSP